MKKNYQPYALDKLVCPKIIAVPSLDENKKVDIFTDSIAVRLITLY